ncbi:hypothetical protein [Acinetobacter pittii]|uniref:hypothetical protein n=1 Tax=Acinetobacter pittii TaxID=48296 RepID=UPI001BD05E6F|nr:hypothetical protein [Acinetobacter pittii]
MDKNQNALQVGYEREKSIEEVLKQYLIAIDGITSTAKIALPHILKWKLSEFEILQNKLKKFKEIINDETGKKGLIAENARDFAEITECLRQLEVINKKKHETYLAKSLFTQLFAEFDAYIGELLKVIYLGNEDLLKGIVREISLADIMDFSDLDSVKISILNKEIETLRRDSYIEQFSALEKKFKIELKKFPEWSAFVELSQRRNIIMHNGGVVSDQYINICQKEGHKFENTTKIGSDLDVGFEYFMEASRILSKVGLMLAYTLWSKVFPKQIEELHLSLNNTVYDFLLNKKWRFVSELGDFVFSKPMLKDIQDIHYKIRIVNYTIGLKFSDQNSKAEEMLSSVDWSANYRDFRLAIAVLKENYSDAIQIMKSIGKNGELIEQHSYHIWPLFSRFREQQEFYDAYYEIYGEHFSESLELPNETINATIETATSSSDDKRSHEELIVENQLETNKDDESNNIRSTDEENTQDDEESEKYKCS